MVAFGTARWGYIWVSVPASTKRASMESEEGSTTMGKFTILNPAPGEILIDQGPVGYSLSAWKFRRINQGLVFELLAVRLQKVLPRLRHLH
jgi:hypothetical protein